MNFIESSLITFKKQKSFADKAIQQLSIEHFKSTDSGNENSICILMKHISGNLDSRWSNFLIEDGEKEWRERDKEFVDDFDSIDEILSNWERGWTTVFKTFSKLKEEDLDTVVAIRGEPHSVYKATLRSISHTSYHVGQIVSLAKLELKSKWRDVTVVDKDRRFSDV